MSHDTYYPCPCGSGRKVKYCCGKQVAADLEKIMRALSGDQHAAALNLVRMARKHSPDNPALLVLQCEMELELGNRGELEDTLGHLMRVAPRNPVGLALMAVKAVEERRAEDAVGYVQDALEVSEQAIPQVLYEAIGATAQVLLASSKIAAAISHLLLQAAISAQGDDRALEALQRLSLSNQIPPTLKYQRHVRPADDDAPWKDQNQKVLEFVGRGRWRQACELLEKVDQHSPNQPTLLYNLANLQMRLGWDEEAAVNWGRLAALDGLPLDDAVEAEALAQVLDPDDRGPHVEQVRTTFLISNSDNALERLLSERRLNAMPDQVRRATVTNQDEPPPKAGFWLLDRPLPVGSAELGWRDLPVVLGQLLLFGRQTDRNARLEYTLFRDEQFEDHKRWLSEFLGGAAQFESENVLGSMTATDYLLMWRWRFPAEMPSEKRLQAYKEKREHLLLEEWPLLKMAELDGQSPTEAASDPDQRICLLALLLNLELEYAQLGWDFDVNQLRRKLQLPTRETIEPPIGDPMTFPMERIGYLRLEALADDDLMMLFPRAVGVVAWSVSSRMMDELERRQASLAERFEYDQAYAEMAAFAAEDSGTAVTYLGKARDAAVARGQSPARYLIESLPHLVQLGDLEQLQSTIATLQRQHLSEPGVEHALEQFLNMLRASVQRGRQQPPASSGGGDTPAVGQEASEAPSRLWTPDGASEAASDSDRPKIWVPGMD